MHDSIMIWVATGVLIEGDFVAAIASVYRV